MRPFFRTAAQAAPDGRNADMRAPACAHAPRWPGLTSLRPRASMGVRMRAHVAAVAHTGPRGCSREAAARNDSHRYALHARAEARHLRRVGRAHARHARSRDELAPSITEHARADAGGGLQGVGGDGIACASGTWRTRGCCPKPRADARSRGTSARAWARVRRMAGTFGARTCVRCSAAPCNLTPEGAS